MRKLLQTSVFLLASMSANATTFGPVENFDVINDDPQGRTAHGFEIVMHGIAPSDITSIFGDDGSLYMERWSGMERYGVPTISTVGDATVITYKANYGGNWSVGTGAGTLKVAPVDSCWPLGDPTYNTSTYPCDHFGVSTNKVATSVEYNWLFESSPGQLAQTPAQVAAPIWNVIPQPAIQPAPINGVVQDPIPQPPVVEVHVRAPEPIDLEFGEPQWVKVTAAPANVNMEVGDLVQNNAAVKEAKKNVQIEWQLLQTDLGNPAAGNIDLSGVKLDNKVRSVIYTFEYYEYTGEILAGGEANPKGSDTPAQPDPTDLGNWKSTQMAAVNLDGAVAPPPAPAPIAPAIDNAVVDGVIGVPYSQVVTVTPGAANDVIALSVSGLPSWASFDAATNTISGTPDAVGPSTITIKADDLTNSTTTSINTTFNVAGVGITDFLPAPPDAVVGENYSYVLTSTGGYGAITYTASDLPAGLTLTGDTISGIPTTAGVIPGAYAASDAYGDSAPSVLVNFRVNPAPVVVPVACSGTGEVIMNLGRAGWFNTNASPYLIYYPDQAHTTLAPGLSTFANGYLVAYSGTVDATGLKCIANTMSVWQALNVATPTFPKGTVGSAYTATPITVTGGWSPYTIAVAGLPSGLAYVNGAVSGTPAVSGTFAVSVSATDDKGNSFNLTNLSIVIDPKPVVVPPSCAKPAGATNSTAHAKVTAVSGKQVTVGSKVFTVADCATIVYKGTAKAIVVGYDVEVKAGYKFNGVNIATSLIVDNGK